MASQKKQKSIPSNSKALQTQPPVSTQAMLASTTSPAQVPFSAPLLSSQSLVFVLVSSSINPATALSYPKTVVSSALSVQTQSIVAFASPFASPSPSVSTFDSLVSMTHSL